MEKPNGEEFAAHFLQSARKRRHGDSKSHHLALLVQHDRYKIGLDKAEILFHVVLYLSSGERNRAVQMA